MSRPHSSSLLAMAWLVFGLAPVRAEVATALLVEDTELPGAPGENIDALSNTATNHAGGYAATVNTSGSGTTLSHVWGSADIGPGDVLVTEGTYGGFAQTSFESFFGISDAGEPSYSPIGTNLDTGSSGIDAVWVSTTPVLAEEDPIPTLPPFFSSFNSRPGITADGQPYWVGGYTDVAGGSTDGRVLFFGYGATPVLKAGDSIGLADVIGFGSDIGFDYRFSALGTHYIVDVLLDVPSATDNTMVVDGLALDVDGIVREGSPVPVSIGGLAGENWANFDYMGINEAGQVFFTGDTSAATAMDEFVFFDGQIVLREGSMVPSEGGPLPLNGAIEGGYLNENGDWAVIWDVDTMMGNVEALIFNGEVVLQEGELVDLDGDGVVEPNSVLRDFTGISALTISDRVGGLYAYFTADVDTMGTASSSDDVEGFFRFRLLADSDGDGILDEDDECPESDLSPTVLIDDCDSGVVNGLDPSGCTLADRLEACREGAESHGAWVSCVAHLVQDFAQAGLIENSDKGKVVRCAAQADVP